jgi:polysaccharide export outer membrane protein
MKGKVTVTMVLLLGLSAAAAAWAQDDAKADTKAKEAKGKDNSAAASDPSAAGPVAGATYIIGADDTLHIDVWKESDLTATLPVRSDGMISLPLLNDVQAAGLTPMQLAASLTNKLKKYLADPRVTVVVTQMNSQRYYVTGEVLHTGAQPLLPNMTVLQALANAGFTQFANTKGIYVLRAQNGKQQKIVVNYKQLVKGDAMGQNILLKPGDTIVVP